MWMVHAGREAVNCEQASTHLFVGATKSLIGYIL